MKEIQDLFSVVLRSYFSPCIGYVQGGQEAKCGYLLLGIYYRRIPGDIERQRHKARRYASERDFNAPILSQFGRRIGELRDIKGSKIYSIALYKYSTVLFKAISIKK
jgi:hypothetical protein